MSTNFALLKSALLVLSFTIGLVLFFPQPALAQDDSLNKACQNASDSPVCQDFQDPQGDPIGGENGLIVDVINVLSFIAGVVAVIIIIVGGIQMMTSAGDSQKFASARNTLIYAVVGLLVVLFSQAIVRFVIFRIL